MSSGGAAAGSATPRGRCRRRCSARASTSNRRRAWSRRDAKGRNGSCRWPPGRGSARLPGRHAHGTVVLTSASGHGGTQTARFWNGLFRVGRPAAGSPIRPLAARPLGCGGGKRRTRRHHGSRGGSRHRAQASRRRHKKGHGGGRDFWGSGKGQLQHQRQLRLGKRARGDLVGRRPLRQLDPDRGPRRRGLGPRGHRLGRSARPRRRATGTSPSRGFGKRGLK